MAVLDRIIRHARWAMHRISLRIIGIVAELVKNGMI